MAEWLEEQAFPAVSSVLELLQVQERELEPLVDERMPELLQEQVPAREPGPRVAERIPP